MSFGVNGMESVFRQIFCFAGNTFLAAALALSAAFAVTGQTPTETAADNIASAARLSDAFAEIASRVAPAVVSIEAKSKAPEVASGERTAPLDPEDIFEFFRRQMPRRPTTAVGSGFIVDKAGYIITNAHVIENANRITVKLDSGEEFIAELIGSDEETDLALLKIQAGHDLPFLIFGDSEQVRVGDWVLAIGSPFGLSRTVTAGIISQTKRETPFATIFQRFIQTDAAINRGNSGGPLVDLNGRVIGVNSQIATSTGDYTGVGFALPSTEAAAVFRQLRDFGKVKRGYLGVLLDSVKDEYAKVYGLKDERGAIITDVRDSDGPAAAAGLKAGDVILQFDGKEIRSAQDLIAKVAGTSPGNTVSVTFLRENGKNLERRTVEMKLAERPSGNQQARSGEGRKSLPVEKPKETEAPFGIRVKDVTPAMATTLKLNGGVVISEINPDSFIADVKMSTGADALDEGDIIIRVNRIPVNDQADFVRILGGLKKGDAVVLQVLTPLPDGRSAQLKFVQFTVQ